MKKKLVAIAAATLVILPFGASPASADTGGGMIAFECVASLSLFPSGGGTGTCGTNSLAPGTPAVPSSASGTITGVTDDGEPFVLVVAGVNNFDASFSYEEACVAGEPPVLGTASGTAEIRGVTGTVGTTSVSGTIEVSFSWVRAGLTAVVTITDGSFPGISGEITGAGTAAFVPLLTAGNTCAGGAPLRALVAGEVEAAVTP